MSEKPQEVRVDEQEDLLEQIITQGLNKMKAPERSIAAEGSAADETPSVSDREDSGEAAPPESKKTRRSSVYLYLLILFGAAFLLLLLAYFVQQRSSESALSGLRDSMNLSREELLAQIRELEEENTALSEELTRLSGDLSQWRQRYEEQVQDANRLFEQNYAAQEELYSWASFWMLENYYQLENLEACAAVLLMQEQGQYTYRAPDTARQAEIIRAVVDEGILDEEYALHPDDYQALLNAYSTP